MRRGSGIVFGALAALPTLVWAAWHPALLVDDWTFAATMRFQGWAGFGRDATARPVQAGYHAVTFAAFGTHPVPHLLLLAVLNGLAGWLVWALARRWTSERVAVLTAVAFAVIANRGSTRMWAATAPVVLGLVLVLAAALVGTAPGVGKAGRGRTLAAVVLTLLGLCCYEAVAGLAFLALVLTAWPRANLRASVAASAARLGLTLAPLPLVLGWMAAHNQKGGVKHPFSDPIRLLAIHAGGALLPYRSLVWVTAVVGILLGAVVWALATLVLPSFPAKVEEKAILAGVGLLALGAGPFIVIGFPQTTDGLLDRTNLYADVGNAVLVAAALALLWRIPWPRVAVFLSTAALVVLGSANLVDLWSYGRAATDGRLLLGAIDRLPPPVRTRGPLVVPPLPNRNGVAMFTEDYDLSAALALRYRTGLPFPRARVALDGTNFDAAPAGSRYRMRGGRLVRAARDQPRR